jgi:two-component system sensor histidine kinase HydH
MRRKWLPLLLIYGSIAVISGFHYYTSTGYHYFHDIYRRLYYIPIIFSAFLYGVRGALISSICISIIYAPHAFWHNAHMDPAGTLEKGLEILLYNVVGLVTGVLAAREKREKERHWHTAQHLEESLNELKSMEQELLQAEKLSAIGQLSAGLAHEIRNPLSSIKGAVEILAADYPPDHRKHRMLKVLDREADRLNKVLTNFLSFARPQKMQFKPSNAVDRLEGVIRLIEAQLTKAHIEIVRHYPDSPPLVVMDDEQLGQVFLNLLLNAIQAMPHGGKLNIDVRVVKTKKDPGLQLQFRDTGVGIKPEDLPNLFNPFFTTKQEGTGLGLAICYRIIEQHGGRIRVESEPGQGTTFSLWLPLEKIDNA